MPDTRDMLQAAPHLQRKFETNVLSKDHCDQPPFSTQTQNLSLSERSLPQTSLKSDREGPPGWAEHPLRSSCRGLEIKLNGEKRIKWREIRPVRCASLAPSAPAAHRILIQVSGAARELYITRACGLRP
jgi:hypothetical protein